MTTALGSFLASLGGLHDASVREISWSIGSRTVVLSIADLYANFEGLPEYPGEAEGSIVFQGIERLHIAVDTDDDRLRIDEMRVVNESEFGYEVELSFWPQGRMTVSASRVSLPDVKLRQG